MTARQANGERGRAAAVANGERRTGCNVLRHEGGGESPLGWVLCLVWDLLGWALLYWANWERLDRLSGAPLTLLEAFFPLPQSPPPRAAWGHFHSPPRPPLSWYLKCFLSPLLWYPRPGPPPPPPYLR